jgi:hypothetical protein
VIVRAIAGGMLAVFLAGPGLRVECLLLCTKTEESAARSSCHDQPADSAAVGASHDCATIAPAVVTAIKRTGTQAAVGLVTAGPARHVAPKAPPRDPLLDDPPRFVPHARLPIPLRI